MSGGKCRECGKPLPGTRIFIDKHGQETGLKEEIVIGWDGVTPKPQNQYSHTEYGYRGNGYFCTKTCGYRWGRYMIEYLIKDGFIGDDGI